MLRTIAYRIPADQIDNLLGQVTSYPLDNQFTAAWSRLPRKRQPDGTYKVPPYRQLASGLTAVHGQPVRLFGSHDLSQPERDAGADALIITRGIIKRQNLTTAFRTWESLIRNDDTHDTLAPLLPSTTVSKAFSDFVRATDSDTVDAPNWVFRCAQWEIMSRLTSSPLSLDRHTAIPLRIDTDGRLLGWDDVLENTWKNSPGFGMAGVTCKIITMAGVPELILRFDAHLTRLDTRWRGSKNTWIERDDTDLPILRVEVQNVPPHEDHPHWSTRIRNYTAEIAQACVLERLSLDQDLPERPGRIRPIVGKPRMHPVGKGVGARFMLRLAEHIERQLPELRPLSWERDSRARLRQPPTQVITATTTSRSSALKIAVHPEIINSTARASGYSAVHLACLYSSPNARQRMAEQVRALSGEPVLVRDDDMHELSPGVAVSFHHAPKLLDHGDHDRALPAQELAKKLHRDSSLVLALAETEWDVNADPPKHDGKKPARRELAKNGIATQFLATKPESTGTRRRRRTNASSGTDYAAMAALRDLLLRAGGTVHPELAQLTLGDVLSIRGLPKVTFLGVHARLQTTGQGDPRLVLTTTAIRASADPSVPWEFQMYSEHHGEWLPNAAGLAAFHASPIGNTERGRFGEKAVQTRLHMETVIDALGGGPTIIFVDAGETRTIWPGLQNKSFGTGPLPGSNLIAAGNDVAIVRCNTSAEVPRPIDRTLGKRPNDPRQPAAPDRYLYRLADTDQPIWLLPKSSRVYRSMGGRRGASYTRWSLPDDQWLGKSMSEDWHSYTGMEIAVVQDGGWNPVDLAGLAARLSDHTVSWDDRTRHPIPLHLAAGADRDHPDYRTAAEDPENSVDPPSPTPDQ